MSTIYCAGPGPHAPVDGDLGEVPEGTPVGRALCGPCGERAVLPAAADPVVPALADVAAYGRTPPRMAASTGSAGPPDG